MPDKQGPDVLIARPGQKYLMNLLKNRLEENKKTC